ncbi:phage tail tape measure protein [Providencia rettgeri]|uniref:phage tail tape measure protein n=1 Tax=Providencia rettgeri TaxID=587 RepID=UPI001BADC07A|nr:phage tail tape measure protein [Providencia rettgeri]MBS0861367.1 phage tail tape measure protein [Providencia rettgeri]MBS0875190.1 phage tail tape measure protein [Providencia rettgeri]MBS0921492.1 phage tail tape measure protein [Providencia rettgeri]
MAGNTFDFELVADDKASGVIRQIETELSRLRPSVRDAKENLRLGGNDTVSSMGAVGDKLRDISDVAKNGVQNIGDMIPPLKNFGELSSKYLGLAKKIGGIGAVGYAGYQMAAQIRDEGRKATEVSTSAKSMGMTVEEETRLTGTLQQRGIDEPEARQSMSAYYVELDKAVKGQNNELLASIRQIGANIYQKQDGTVDVTKTLQSLEKAISKMPESRNWELQSKVGLDNNMLGLMREGKFDERLEKSDQLGLTRHTEVVEKLSELDATLNELGAAWDGRKTKVKDGINGFFADDSVKEGLGGIQEILTHGPDSAAINRTLGIINGDESKILRWAYETPEFYDKLDWGDQAAVSLGFMTDNVQKEYDKWQKTHTPPKIEEPVPDYGEVPDNWVQHDKFNPNTRGLRNKNPGNLRDANNKIGFQGPEGDQMAVFASERDGLAAMSRQLMLDAERGKNRIDDYIRKYAPASENKTQEYIDMVSKQTGYGAYESLDMHDPEVLAKLMNAMIKVENGAQPFSYDQIMEGIMDSIMDDRWKGLRNPTKVMEQRDMIALREEKNKSKQRSQVAPLINTDNQATQAIDMITNALSEALQQNAKLEITVVSGDKKTTQYLTPKSNGRITIPMETP